MSPFDLLVSIFAAIGVGATASVVTRALRRLGDTAADGMTGWDLDDYDDLPTSSKVAAPVVPSFKC